MKLIGTKSPYTKLTFSLCLDPSTKHSTCKMGLNKLTENVPSFRISYSEIQNVLSQVIIEILSTVSYKNTNWLITNNLMLIRTNSGICKLIIGTLNCRICLKKGHKHKKPVEKLKRIKQLIICSN